VRVLGIAIVVAATSVYAAPPKQQAKKATQTARKKPAPKLKKPAQRKLWRGELPDATSTPAYRYSTMTQVECEAELTARKIGFVREQPTLGVLAPVRLTGPLHGVEYRTNLKEAQRKTTIWEIGDCRLILALDDFAVILAAHDVVDVRHYSMYRKPDSDWPADKPAMRHNGGLAIDAARFNFKDGTYLDVDKHYNGAIGDTSCGDKATPPHPATPEAVKLRGILCEAVAKHLFNVVLTPNYNKPHKNHFHLEVTAGWKSFLVD
jgi:hypothetical protein